MFIDRVDAGEKLAGALDFLRNKKAIVLAIPRGGVVVAAEVARSLNLPLSLIIPRKIGAPGNPELAIGAVAGEGITYLEQDIVQALDVSPGYIQEETLRQVKEIKRREEIYSQGRAKPDLSNRIVVIVDDGIATGSTAIAAVRAVKDQKPAKVILAVPVAPIDGKKRLEKEADEVIVLENPVDFQAVGQFYGNFDQTSDEEVENLLTQI